MPIYPYSFQLPPLSAQDIPNNGAVGEFLGISAGGVLDWLPVSTASGDMLKSENLSGLANYTTARTNIGLGTASTPTFANLTLTSPSLALSAPVTISQTWNAVGQTFTAFKVNAAGTSDANSASGSLLADFQLNGVSKALVAKSGVLVANTFALGGDYPIGITRIGDGGLRFIRSNVAGAGFSGISPILDVAFDGIDFSLNLVNVAATLRFGSDTRLQRDGAANTLALRNGANAQTFRVYNTFPGTGNNEFGSLNWVDLANEFQISTGQAGTGTSRALCLRSSGGINIRIGGAPGTLAWQVAGTTGHFLAGTDNTYDIGANGANRPRNIYVGTSLFTGVGGINFDINARLRSPATDVITLYNNGLSDFNRIQFGGTTNLFPAIKRNAAGLQIRLADDSANATLEAGNLYASGNVGIGTTAPGALLQVSYANQVLTGNVTDTAASSKHHIAAYTPDTAGINVGASLGLGGNYLGTSNYVTFGAIAGRKELAINNNAQGYLSFLTASNGSGIIERMRIDSVGNVGIGTTAPTSKLHVAGSSSPSITVDNTLATGASQLLFKNTVVTGDTDGIFLNGSAQSGFGGNGSLNIKATTGPIAFHTATVTNALSIAQNGVATFAISIAVNSAVRTSFINNIGDSLSMFNFVNDSTGTSTYAVGGSAPLMRFGGTTTSFPAIKRSATTLQVRLANDSDFAPIQGKLTTETAFTATTVTPTGFITLYDSTGIAYKVPCVPA